MREVFLFFFHLKNTLDEALRELQKVYGNAALSETICCDWFSQFIDSGFDIDDCQSKGKLNSTKSLSSNLYLIESVADAKSASLSISSCSQSHLQVITSIESISKARSLDSLLVKVKMLQKEELYS
ncbi:uncharacterized protein LOC134199721 [Bombyx mori]|uniref:uncharacterized protein LOC134199721 n=1 Tax=Bombyx mori TaxID=7091 RepID=UPI000640A120